MEWWPKKSRIGPQLPENACKSGGYLPVSGGQFALVMAEVTTTNHCGQNTVCGLWRLKETLEPRKLLMLMSVYSLSALFKEMH